MDLVEYTQIGAARLYLQDNKQVIKTIPSSSIDLILTDPPYNISKYSTGNIELPNRTPLNNDIASWDDIEINPEDYVEDFKRILKPNGNIFVFTTYNSIGKWHAAFDKHFDTTQFMVWHKTNPTPNIFKKSFLNSCELVICFWNKGHTWNFSDQNGMHNFIESPICMGAERLKNPKHPAQKPVKILKHIIQIASNPNDVVFDPFMGVASSAIAALELKRKFYGCEINKLYYNAGVGRVKDYYSNHN
jgi:site-specific DNA-methyltransferase (adenine-specific)/modification methylase